MNCLWWRGVFHICEGNVPFSDKGAYFFSQIKDVLVVLYFSLPGALRSHVWTPPPPVSDTLEETKRLCPTLFLNYGHFLSQTNKQSFNWYFVQFSITKFLRKKKDKCCRFKSSLSWWLLFLQCTSKCPLKASHALRRRLIQIILVSSEICFTRVVQHPQPLLLLLPQ